MNEESVKLRKQNNAAINNTTSTTVTKQRSQAHHISPFAEFYLNEKELAEKIYGKQPR